MAVARRAGVRLCMGRNRTRVHSLIDLVVFGRAAAIKAGESRLIRTRPFRAKQGRRLRQIALDRFDALRHAKARTTTAESCALEMKRPCRPMLPSFATDIDHAERLPRSMGQRVSRTRWDDISYTEPGPIGGEQDLIGNAGTDQLMPNALAQSCPPRARQESRGAHSHEDYPRSR